MLWVWCGVFMIVGTVFAWAGQQEGGAVWTVLLCLLVGPPLLRFLGTVRMKEDFYGNAHVGGAAPRKSRPATDATPNRPRPSQHVPNDDS
jgi:hypothetical protein